jgi:small subunit ribosomal protein S1
LATSATPTRDDFAALLNQSLGGENEGFEGRVVTGTVTAIENDLAVIDVGLKSEGRVPLREFAAPGQKAELNVGDKVEVYVDRIENTHGEAMLSATAPAARPPGTSSRPNIMPATASRA